ncbi:MAG: hypothetical protein WBM50_26810 [Acidimicrobiales bacterium]
MAILSRLLTVCVLVLAACSQNTGGENAAATTSQRGEVAEQSDPVAGLSDRPGESSAAFCSEAGRFIDDPSVTDVGNVGPQFFADIDRRLARLVETAPAGVVADVEALRAGFVDSDRIFAEFDYETDDAGLAEALGRVDNQSMLTATENIRRFLGQECGTEGGGAVDSAQVDDIVEAFGVDRSLAECINVELGDVANIDSSELTPELLSRPVCGTSLLAILSAGGGG